MKHLLICAAASAALLAEAGVNLVADPEVDVTPLSNEFRLVTTPKEGLCELSRFEEDLIWNGCVRLSVVDFGVSHRQPRGKPKGEKGQCLSSAVEIGGSSETPGFTVRGGEKLKFTFMAKGTAYEGVVGFRTWNEKGVSKNVPTTVGRFKVNKDWTPVKGEVELPADAVRGALVVQLWYDEMYGRMIYKVGDYLMIDKFDISRKVVGREIWPARAVVLPADGSSVSIGGLRSAAADVPAKARTDVEARADAEKVTLDIRCENASWWKPSSETDVWMRFDDRVEIFFGQPGKGGLEAHFGVSAGGGRWASMKKYDEWSSHVVKDGTCYKAKVEIPWRTIGLKRAPRPGEPVAFQICRTRMLGPVNDKGGERGTSQGYGRWMDDSSWNFDKGEFTNKDRWGVLFVGGMGGLDESNPTASWMKHLEELEDTRLKALRSQPFVLAQVPPHVDAEIPFMPDELYDPQKTFSAKAAGNERMFIAVALANMTDETEEYRAILTCGLERPNPWNEIPVTAFGMKRDDGHRYPGEKVTIYRAGRYRDADTPGHGKRFDPLTPLTGLSSVTVAAKETGLLWIEFDTHGVEPGVYRGDLVVTPLSAGCFRGAKNGIIDDDSKVVPVVFEVRPFALPEPSDMALFSVARAYSEYTIDFLKKYHETRYMLTPWNFEADFDAEGRLVRRRPRPWTVPQLKLLADNVPKIHDHPRLSVCYASYRHFRDEISKKQPYKFNTEAYWRAYREWVRYVDDVIVSNGVARDDYVFELLDEPQLGSEGWNKFTREEVKRAVAETKSALPGCKIYIASGVDNFFEVVQDKVDEWCFYQNNDRHYPIAREWAKKPGKKPTEYDCNTSMRISPYRYYRMLPWKAAAAGGDFTVIFQFIFQTPYLSIRKTPYGEYAYDTGREIIPSLRGENLYLGLEDIRYLKLLEKISVGDSDAAKRGRAFVTFALKDVPFTRPHDFAAAEEFREKASALIVEIMRLGK